MGSLTDDQLKHLRLEVLLREPAMRDEIAATFDELVALRAENRKLRDKLKALRKRSKEGGYVDEA